MVHFKANGQPRLIEASDRRRVEGDEISGMPSASSTKPAGSFDPADLAGPGPHEPMRSPRHSTERLSMTRLSRYNLLLVRPASTVATSSCRVQTRTRRDGLYVVICREILRLPKRTMGQQRRTRLDRCSTKCRTWHRNRRILEAYARIDAWTHGNPVNSPRNAPPPRQAVPMKQNDIWVAATAHASGSALLSTDKDFAHLDDVWFDFTWIDQKRRVLPD